MPSGASSASGLARALLPVVEDGVESEVAQPLELLLGPGAPDDAAARDCGHLAGGAAHGARRARYEHRLALLRQPEREHPVPGGEARHPENAERGRERGCRGVEAPQGRAVGECPLAPAELMEHPLALRVPRVAGRGDATDRAARHRLAQRERRDVRADVVHPRPHVRIDGEVRVADQHLTLGGAWNRRLGDLEEILLGEALRPRDEADLA